jgi:pyruvate/2-oxoglutarate dehydrogenase complex dihydrolipoamide dehydrogenase (E3) component
LADSSEFDVVVLGAGPSGEVCAGRLAQNGLEVALVEQELVGGECSYYACMPSKALLRPAQALAETRRVAGAAQAATGELDVAAALARRDEIIHGLDDAAQMPWLDERAITLVRGHGTILDTRRVQVGAEVLRARRAVVLAPGSAAAIPPIPGLREAEPWTNRQATTAGAIPESLLVLGGGVVGVEMACAYASLGAAVTIVEAHPRLISGEEQFASELLTQSLQRAGVEIALGIKATAVRRAAAEVEGSSAHAAARRGAVTVELEDGRSFTGAELLVATGRKIHSSELGLELLGLQPGEPVVVGETMQVPGHDWLYVVGDANGRVLLTHMGKYQARLAANHILGKPVELRSDGRLAPRVIFTEPQIAAVGHTLASAAEAGLNARAVDREVGEVAGGSFVGHGAPGMARIVIDDDRGVILGATFVGVEVAEWLHAATIAVVGEVPLRRLWHAVPSFPTRSEVWLKLLEGAGL